MTEASQREQRQPSEPLKEEQKQQQQRLAYIFYDEAGEKREYLYEPYKKHATWINRVHPRPPPSSALSPAATATATARPSDASLSSSLELSASSSSTRLPCIEMRRTMTEAYHREQRQPSEPLQEEQRQRRVYIFYDGASEKREYLYEPHKKHATWINRVPPPPPAPPSALSPAATSTATARPSDASLSSSLVLSSRGDEDDLAVLNNLNNIHEETVDDEQPDICSSGSLQSHLWLWSKEAFIFFLDNGQDIIVVLWNCRRTIIRLSPLLNQAVSDYIPVHWKNGLSKLSRKIQQWLQRALKYLSSPQVATAMLVLNVTLIVSISMPSLRRILLDRGDTLVDVEWKYALVEIWDE